MNAGPGGSEPSESDKAAEAALEAAIRRTGYASSPAAPKPVDHYAILGLAHDFTPAELKRRYKKASLAAHPDRAGGSLSVSICLCLCLCLCLSLSLCLCLSVSLCPSVSVLYRVLCTRSRYQPGSESVVVRKLKRQVERLLIREARGSGVQRELEQRANELSK